MKIMNRIHEKANDNANKPGVTIAFLGDSVTQGCFELYKKSDGSIETVFDKTNAYHTYLNRILSLLYPSVPVNIINAGISGDNATHGFERLERDVLRYADKYGREFRTKHRRIPVRSPSYILCLRWECIQVMLHSASLRHKYPEAIFQADFLHEN